MAKIKSDAISIFLPGNNPETEAKVQNVVRWKKNVPVRSALFKLLICCGKESMVTIVKG